MKPLNREQRAVIILLVILAGILFTWRACTWNDIPETGSSTELPQKPVKTSHDTMHRNDSIKGKRTRHIRADKSGMKPVKKHLYKDASPLEKPVRRNKAKKD